MKNTYKSLLALGAAGMAAALWLMWPQPAIAPLAAAPAPADAATLAQGARIVALGDCMVCHTAKGGAPYAGAYPLRTPFGTIYSTNITPDADTGIGRWSFAAFERALRHGVSRDGHLLYPAFPYTHYTRMTDADIRSAYDYLMSRTPVRTTQPANELVFPLNFRPVLAGWNLLFLRPGNRITAQQQQAGGEVTRGEYLVDGMGHCASCHSGLNTAGGEKSPAFGGGHIDGWDAPALIALKTLPVPWSRADLVDYLHTGLSRVHGAAKGPMQPVTAHLSEVPETDVRAIVAYLDHIQQAGALEAGPSAPPARAAIDAQGGDATLRSQGAMLFAAACAACHGASAPMNAVNGSPGLDLSRSTTDARPDNFIQTVMAGVQRQHEPARVYMPPFADVFTDGQVQAVAAYVRADIAGRPAWPDLDKTIKTIRKDQQP